MKDKLTVVKIGGKIINSSELLSEFLEQFSKIEGKKILVHGGGQSASNMLKTLGIEPKMLDGRRITCEATLDVCIGQYAGSINKNIVALLQANGVNALGLSGADGGIIKANKRPKNPIDYGFAGDIESVDSEKLLSLLNLDFVPVFCAITADTHGQLLNTNADTIASTIAVSMGSYADVHLKFCFEFDGILYNIDSKEVVLEIEGKNTPKLIEQGILKGGVIPKVHNAISAKENGVNTVAICGITNLVDLHNSTNII